MTSGVTFSRHVNAIAGRLSLRAPQRESLEILARVADLIPLKKGQDLAQALTAIQAGFPTVTDFERDFPSLCFALATGVGKTRLMGAFISYLHLAHGINNFFVLAPNLTIYNKLITDFTPNHPKYVFQGIAEFAVNGPAVITGDNYEKRDPTSGLLFGGVRINIFNISQINSEVRGGKVPRIKRLSEYIGQSYFDYLSGLDDLVLLMDESHRYRASAGVRAINELKPILGLELTATPQIEAAGGPVPFKNVIYSYPLASALADGFVKEPAVATRENFDPANYTEPQLERLKLEDGVLIHENAKADLEIYARQNNLPLVKPFMLVVAQDTKHANEIVATIKDDAFFKGRYKDRVITVHSNQRGEEADETVARLLVVESPAEPTEIVVHVNMLKEGWDVTNLYTIVPLRAARSKTLVEQSIGRGLRLPYGKRVGVPAVDRLTIVAHDMFQAIIDQANNPNSIIRTGVVIGRDIPLEGKQTIVVQPEIVERITAKPAEKAGGQQSITFATPAEQEVAKTTLEVLRKFESLPRSYDLKSPEVQAQIAQEVAAVYVPVQGVLEGIVEQPNIPEIVSKMTDLFIELTIDIPRIILVPKGEMVSGYRDFDLDVSGIHLQPVADNILIEHLRTHERERISDGTGIAVEPRPENYLVRALINYNDISYDDHADLLYELAGQMVSHLRSYLPDEQAVLNVLQYHQQRLADLIHVQMQAHYWEKANTYEAKISRGFTTPPSNAYSTLSGENARDFRAPVEERQYIRGMVFNGFRRCLYRLQKFDSDSERRFAIILEDDVDVMKWFKPAKGQFQIYYHHDQSYEPDFVVETKTAKYLCEPKRATEVDDPEVLAKARAAVEWCKHATEHERVNGGKPWSYLLIPHDAITASKTLGGLTAAYKKI
ncbi:MAG: DEAD/DEAH box helicase family protein [Sulfuricaulis sp.]|nr:DEAD/DEAH box helicase family protein [Sulfuricaulis sp.]